MSESAASIAQRVRIALASESADLESWLTPGSGISIEGALRTGVSRTPTGPLRESYGTSFASLSTAQGHPARADFFDLEEGKLTSVTTLVDAEGEGTDTVRRALSEYVARVGRGDAEATLALFGDDPYVEDPVGTPGQQGRAAVEAFYHRAVESIRGTELLAEPIAAHAGLGCVCFHVDLELRGTPQRIEVIDRMTFDAEGQISSMRAFWGRANRSSRIVAGVPRHS